MKRLPFGPRFCRLPALLAFSLGCSEASAPPPPEVCPDVLLCWALWRGGKWSRWVVLTLVLLGLLVLSGAALRFPQEGGRCNFALPSPDDGRLYRGRSDPSVVRDPRPSWQLSGQAGQDPIRPPPNPLMQPTNAGDAGRRPRPSLPAATMDRRFSQVVCS